MHQEDNKIFELGSLCYPSIVLLGCLVTSIGILAVVYKHLNRREFSNSSSSAMPGPQLPLFGILALSGIFPSRSSRKKLSLPSSVYNHQTLDGIAEMYRKEKIIGLFSLSWNVVLLTKAESVEEFMKSNVPSTKPFRHVMTPFFGNGLFLSAGQKWKSRRKVVTPLFHYDVIKQFIPIMDRESKVLGTIFNSRRREGGIDIWRPISLCAMDITCASFLGTNLESQKKNDSQFVDAMDRVLHTIGKRLISPWYHFDTIFMMTALGKQFKKDMDFLRSYCMKVIKEREENNHRNGMKKEENKTKKRDVLELGLEWQRNNPEITDEELRNELLSFIFAGEDTTAVGMTFTLYLIGLYPEVQRKIHEELDDIFGDDINRPVTEDDLKRLSYVECVVKESQRLYPSVPHNMKQILEDVVLCGYEIKKGTFVSVDAHSIHRDPDVFPNPEVFNPDRFLPANSRNRDPYAYVPFSGGIRNCLGQRFAMMEMKIIVANVLRCFSLKSLEHRDKICIASDLLLRPVHPVKVEFIPR